MDSVKKYIKSKWFSVPFVLIVGFIAFYWMITMVMEEFNFMDRKVAAGVSAVLALFMLFPQFRKKREYKDIEHGSSEWATAKDCKRFADPDFYKNIILSAGVVLSMNMYMTHRNCHVFVVGGSGSGKSRYYAKSNIMQMNASYVITDPSGEHLRDEGKMLKEHGYNVKVFDVVHMERSMHFNPFVYFKSTEDILRFINIFIANTGGGQAQNKDDFWSNAEKLWLMAHISYIQETCQDSERNMNSLVMLLNNSEARDDDEEFKSAVDILFDDLQKQNSQSFAVKQYKKYKLAAGKTAKSILISVGVRLSYFDIPNVSALFDDDELELNKLGDEKSALFIIVNDHDTTYNFLVAILLDTLFNTLATGADENDSSHLIIPVRCILDEIANIGFFPNLHVLIAVLRRRWVSLELLFQNLNQLKSLYKDNWATIEGNCDTTVFLGGKGEDTTKYVSNDLLGKATIDTVSYGSSGSSSTFGNSGYNSHKQKAGRNLLDETEVAKLDDDECIVSIRGLNPFKGKKYDPVNHPNYKYLADANRENAYRYHRGQSFQGEGIQYITMNLQEEF